MLAWNQSWGIDSRFLLNPADLPRVQPQTKAPKEKPSAVAQPPAASTSPPVTAVPAPLPQVQLQTKVAKEKPVRSGQTAILAKNALVRQPRKPSALAVQSLRHGLRLNGMKTSSPVDNVTPLLNVWPKIAALGVQQSTEGIEVHGAKFSLSFDPARYPTLQASDGGKILLDTAGTLPPLVRSLVTGKDRSIRVVSEDPSNRRRFLSSVLGAAGFYSVEENFTVTHGIDPQLKVFADFKVERKADSLMGQDLLLVNHNERRRPLSPELTEFLRKEGFTVVEPYASRQAQPVQKSPLGSIYRLSGVGVEKVTDTLLQALSLPVTRDRNVELYSLQHDGVKLDVKADRSFTLAATPYVICFFDGDPVNYTLSRLLETKGYRVTVLDGKENFTQVGKKLLTKLQLDGSVGVHALAVRPDSPYGISLSGLEVTGRSSGGKQIILTDRQFTPIVRALAEEAGFRVIDQE